MSRNDDHREVSSGRASQETTRRFKGALRREVGDLEVRLEEAQLRSNAFLHAGLDREAAQVLQESRQMVDDFHQRLNSALAAAAVEREAEWILASSLDVVDVLGEDATTGGGLLARIPAGVGAAVASIAVLAMAMVTLRTPQQRDLQPASDVALALPGDGADAGAAASALLGNPALDRRLRSFSPAEIEVLAAVPEPEAVVPLLERRRRLLDQLAASAGRGDVDTVLAELDLLVEALVREGVDIDRLMELERAQEFERVEEPEAEPEQGQAQDPAPEPQAPSDQPQEPAAEDEADDGSADDGSVFPLEEGDGESAEGSEGGSEDAGASDSGDGSSEDGKSEDGGLLGD